MDWYDTRWKIMLMRQGSIFATLTVLTWTRLKSTVRSWMADIRSILRKTWITTCTTTGYYYRSIWNSPLCFFPFPSLCTANPRGIPFLLDPNVSTFSSRERIQRDWKLDSPSRSSPPSAFNALVRWPSGRSLFQVRHARFPSLREREFDRGFEEGDLFFWGERAEKRLYPSRERKYALERRTLSRSG